VREPADHHQMVEKGLGIAMDAFCSCSGTTSCRCG
jgi:hypothetical protein